MNTFQDKVVLITGSSSGIGRAVALRLAQYGAKVILAARGREALADVQREIENNNGVALCAPTDVTDATQCEKVVETTMREFGQLDIVINSAGVSMKGFFADSKLPALEKLMQVNFFGTMYITHFALPHIKKSKGSLVAISSLSGKRGTPYYTMYGATKFAIQGLYDSLRLELRKDGVHVGIFAPGFVDTPLHSKVLRPDGEVWTSIPKPPLRIWPVEKCVNNIVYLLRKRKSEVLLPWFVRPLRPLMAVDKIVGTWLGDWFFTRRFRPEDYEI